MDTIDRILGDTKEELMSFGNRRIKYMPYDMDIALQVVDRIGKGIDPRFELTNKVKEVYKRLIQFFHADPEFEGDLDKGFILMGPTGTGKTMAMEIMRKYRTIDDTKFIINNRLYRMNFDIIDVNRMVNQFMDNSFDGIQVYCNRFLICMDDIGTEIEQVKHYGNTLDVVSHVLAERYAKKLMTFATTNYPISVLEDKYDDRVISRMYALFNFIEMKERDFRKFR